MIFPGDPYTSVDAYLYITPNQLNRNDTCGIAFYVIERTLYKFIDCPPYENSAAF